MRNCNLLRKHTRTYGSTYVDMWTMKTKLRHFIAIAFIDDSKCTHFPCHREMQPVRRTIYLTSPANKMFAHFGTGPIPSVHERVCLFVCVCIAKCIWLHCCLRAPCAEHKKQVVQNIEITRYKSLYSNIFNEIPSCIFNWPFCTSGIFCFLLFSLFSFSSLSSLSLALTQEAHI